MLLVKSKESKNSNNLARLAGVIACAITPVTWAQSDTGTAASTAPSLSSWLTVAFSLLMVLAVIFMLAYLMRRFSFTHSGGGQIKTVASVMVGTRERIAVIQVGDEQHLIGVTSQNINHLAKLENPLSEDSNNTALKNSFASLLKQQKKLQSKD